MEHGRSPLPLPPMRLIGRERDLAATRAIVLAGEVRLLTLTGVGGGGKTRLAQALASDLRTECDERVYWVGLASITSGALVPQTIAGALGVIETPGTPLVDSLTHRLSTGPALLILDNCEHLLDACAKLIERVLAACPEVRILTTSREPLQVAGERQWRVAPLALPSPADAGTAAAALHAPAVQLFVERAQAVDPDFRLTSDTAAVVVEICTRLAGIPLALELAAARVRVLTVQEIGTRLNDSFRLLSGGSRATPARQQTLRAALDWSYDLLTEPEQSCFRRLSVFVGGFSMEAAEAICREEGTESKEPAISGGDAVPILGSRQPPTGSRPTVPCSLFPVPSEDVLDLLTRLVDKSLVVAGSEDGISRYQLLEPVRQYAHRQLSAAGEEAAIRALHAAHYSALAERAEPELRGPAQVKWLARLGREEDNFRATLRWAEAQDTVECALRLGVALAPFWEVRGRMSEGRQWLATFLAKDAATALPVTLRSRARLAAGRLAFWQADLAEAMTLLDECLSLARAANDRRIVAEALTWLGLAANRQRDFTAATRQLEEGRELQRALGDGRGIAWATHGLGDVAANQARHEQALPYFEESLARFQALDDLRFTAIASLELGLLLVFIAGSDLDRARRLLRDALRGLLAVGDRAFLVSGLLTLAEAEAKLGRRPRAARLLGVTAALRDALGVQLSPLQHVHEERVLGTIRPRLGEAALAAAVAEGRTMTVEEALAESLTSDQAESLTPTAVSGGGPTATLTPREREVARLLAQGATDRDIAAELVIAVGTASVHVHRILGKLGLNSRWQVAGWAITHGFAPGPID